MLCLRAARPGPRVTDRSARCPTDPTDRSRSGAGRVRALRAALADAVVVVEKDGTVAYAGPGLTDVLGLDPDAAAGRPILDLVHPDDAVRDEAGGFWNAPLPFERELRMRDASGDWTWVRAISSATDRDGHRPEAVQRVLGNRTLLFVRDWAPDEHARDADDLILKAFDAVNNLVVVVDVRAPDAPLVVVNQNFVVTTGYSREEVIGRNCRFLHDGTRDDDGDGQREALERVRTAVARGASTDVVLRNYKKDGTLFYNRLYLTPIRNGAGELTHFVGVQNDVTDEIARTREVERQRGLLQSFFDSAPLLMGVVELVDGALVHRAANAAAARLYRSTGRAFDGVEAQTSVEIGFTADEAETWRRHVRECLSAGRAVRFETAFPWGADPDGEGVRNLQVVVNPADGADPLVSYVAEDVTDRRAAERERRLLAAAVDQAADAVLVTDAQTGPPGPTILYANRAHQRVFGYEADEVVGQTPRMFQGPKTDRVVLDRIRERLAAGEPVEAETVNYRKDGTEFVLRWEIAPVEDERGAVTHWVGTQRDVTERRRLEREILEISAREQERMARELHDGLGQVLSGAAFRLEALRVSLERLGEEALEADAARSRELIEDALAQARATARGLFPVPVEPDGLMVALGRLATDAAEAYGLDCTFVYDAPVVVAGEHGGHLYRIAQEAVANAVRHGRARTVAITLSHAGGASGGGASGGGPVTLSIQDDGSGIPPGALVGDRGLGLRTMRYRADRVGGTLEVRPRDEGGTVVSVTFTPGGAGRPGGAAHGVPALAEDRA